MSHRDRFLARRRSSRKPERLTGESFMIITRLVVALGLSAAFAAAPMRSQRQAPPTGTQRLGDQWPNYQYNSNFSPLTQITPQNVSRLTQAWTFNYGAGSLPEYPFVGLDNRF